MKKTSKSLGRIFSIVLCLSMLLSMGNVFAEDVGSDGEEIIGEVLLNSRFFNPDGSEFVTYIDGAQPFAPEYNPGTIKIDDVLGATGGIMQADNKNVIGETFKGLSMLIFPNVPVIGNIFSTGSAIIDTLRPIYNSINAIDYSKSLTATTHYSIRNFNHIISAYNDNYRWQEVGNSYSRYYYKHLTVRAFNKNAGEYQTYSEDFTHSKGYPPSHIAKAPNYMNYSKLNQYGYEAYKTGRTYRESC